MAALVAFLFLCGAVVGSFLSVVAHRVPRGLSIVAPRSRCPACETQIRARDNVPIVSWLLLRGRCRDCGEPISARYPLVELSCAVLFAVMPLALGRGADLALGLCFVSVLAAVTLTDLEQRIIPNRIVLVGAIAALAITLVAQRSELAERAIAAGAAGGVLLLAALARPGGMGMGDVKLAGMMGLYLGSAVAPALLVGFATGALVGLVIVARHGAAARKQAVPFGPFLALGGLVGLFAGNAMVDWYVRTFLH